MKIKISLLIIALAFSGGVYANTTKVIAVKPSQAKFTWLAKKITGQHDGEIKLKSADIELVEDKLSGGTWIIDMDSITCRDIKDKKTNQKLIGHLKSDDFFNVAQYPTATLVIKKVKELKSGENTHEITGNLTIKDITKSISFPAKIVVENNKAQATGTLTIDRTKWKIKYASGKFFKGLGDKIIHDTFDLSFDIKASLQ